MKSLLSVIIAAAFAATATSAVAQSKPVDTKGGGAVTSKDGSAVGRKEVKEKPKAGPAPKMAAEGPKKKEKLPKAAVTTKSGGPVTSKDKKEVKSAK